MTNEEVKELFEYCLSEECTDDLGAIQDELTIALEAVEKQIPMKPRETRCSLMCGRCGHKITEKGCVKANRLYCKKCGQKIDWN